MCTGHCCINSIFHPFLGSVCEMVSFISHMSGFLIIHTPPRLPPGADFKPIKHPNILLNMGGLCHVAAPGNASWVIMVITQPSVARPEAPGWWGQTPEPETAGAVAVQAGQRGQGEAGGSRAALSHKPLLSHQRLLDVWCGRSPLLNNPDADERWWQVFE